MSNSLKDQPLNRLTNLSSTKLSSANKLSSSKISSSKLPFDNKLSSSLESNKSFIRNRVKSLSENINSKKTILSDKINKVTDLASNNNNSNNNFKKQTIYIIIFIIILVLSFIGINIFVYLAYGTEIITNFSKPLIESISKLLIALGITSTDIALTGTKSITETSDAVIKTTSDNVSTGITGSIDEIKGVINKDTKDNNSDSEYSDSETSIDENKYCYIGKHKNKRYCAKINDNKKCISGDIYSSLDKCINPNIR